MKSLIKYLGNLLFGAPGFDHDPERLPLWQEAGLLPPSARRV